MIEEYQCGICVHPEQIEDIAESIKWMLEHPDEAEAMGKRGQKAVIEKFNWSLEEKRLVSLYMDLLGEK